MNSPSIVASPPPGATVSSSGWPVRDGLSDWEILQCWAADVLTSVVAAPWVSTGTPYYVWLVVVSPSAGNSFGLKPLAVEIHLYGVNQDGQGRAVRGRLV